MAPVCNRAQRWLIEEHVESNIMKNRFVIIILNGNWINDRSILFRTRSRTSTFILPTVQSKFKTIRSRLIKATVSPQSPGPALRGWHSFYSRTGPESVIEGEFRRSGENPSPPPERPNSVRVHMRPSVNDNCFPDGIGKCNVTLTLCIGRIAIDRFYGGVQRIDATPVIFKIITRSTR
jgi:hypothetical protein